MSECQKMRLFIDNNFAMEYIIWLDNIYPHMKESENDLDLPRLTDDTIDFTIE